MTTQSYDRESLLRGFAGAIGPAQIAVVEKMREMNFTDEQIEAVRGAVSDRLNNAFFDAKEANAR